MSDVPGYEVARAAAVDALQLTQPVRGTTSRREAAVWHDRGVVMKRELAGRTASHGRDAAAQELWNEAEGSQAVSGDEADALARRAQAGDESALEELIRRLLPLVHSTARRYPTEGLEQADLLQEGIVGLLRALQRFDPDRGVPFAAFATWWIRQSLQEARSDFMRPLRLPPKALRQLSQLKSEHQRIYQGEHRSARVAELAERTNMELEQAEALLVAAREPRVKACVAYAPCCNVPRRVGDGMIQALRRSYPDYGDFLAWSSPDRNRTSPGSRTARAALSPRISASPYP